MLLWSQYLLMRRDGALWAISLRLKGSAEDVLVQEGVAELACRVITLEQRLEIGHARIERLQPRG